MSLLAVAWEGVTHAYAVSLLLDLRSVVEIPPSSVLLEPGGKAPPVSWLRWGAAAGSGGAARGGGVSQPHKNKWCIEHFTRASQLSYEIVQSFTNQIKGKWEKSELGLEVANCREQHGALVGGLETSSRH